MRAGAGTLRAAAIVLMAAAVEGAAAQEPRDLRAGVFSAVSRVRCLDVGARRLLETALKASPTVARQVAELQSTNLIVGIETTTDRRTRGEVRIIGATAGTRLLRIRIRVPGAPRALVSVLGHELQHVLEIAAEPGVRDAATLRAYYLRIGYERVSGGLYESESALEAGRRVASELADAPTGARVGPASALR
jgi:hypothetical protein